MIGDWIHNPLPSVFTAHSLDYPIIRDTAQAGNYPEDEEDGQKDKNACG